MPGGTIDISYKDQELETAFAKRLGVPVLLANVTQQVYQMARAQGLNKQDGSAIVKVFEQLAGVTVRERKIACARSASRTRCPLMARAGSLSGHAASTRSLDRTPWSGTVTSPHQFQAFGLVLSGGVLDRKLAIVACACGQGRSPASADR